MRSFNKILSGNDYVSVENDGVTVRRSNTAKSYMTNLDSPTNLFVSLPAEFTFSRENTNKMWNTIACRINNLILL